MTVVFASIVLLALLLWLVLPRRQVEREPWEGESPGPALDREELEAAEREVRELDSAADPEEGGEGDDWGPGTARKPE